MMDPTQLSASLRQWLEIVTARSMRDWMRFVKASGLSMPQFGVLMHLHRGGSCAVSEIGKHMEVTTPAASQLIDGLVEKGLLERVENPADRRLRQISISPKGRALLQKGMAERYRWVDELVAFLTPAQRETLADALPGLLEASQKLTTSTEFIRGA